MAQLEKGLQCKHEEPGPISQWPCKKLGMLTHTFNPVLGRQKQEDPYGLLASHPNITWEHWVPVTDPVSKNKLASTNGGTTI